MHVQKSELGKLALFVDHGNVLTLATNMSQQTFQTMQRNIDPRKKCVYIILYHIKIYIYHIILCYIIIYCILVYWFRLDCIRLDCIIL